MASFHYEWYIVDIVYENGKYPTEFKAKTREAVVRQIEKYVKDSNLEEKQSLDIWHRPQKVLSVDWNTLRLDRTGHQR